MARKKRAMTSEKAREVKIQGKLDEIEFAELIGVKDAYENDIRAKKDVVDLCGDTHSVKGGKKKWQIFLYSKSRFETDIIFQRLNGLGLIFLECLSSFPDSYDDYQKNKSKYKNNLKKAMRKLCGKLQDEKTLRVFFMKSFFNAGEVQYLTIKENSEFLIFHRDDVLNIFVANLDVENSRARQSGQFDDQKVVFKLQSGVTLGEIEIRTDEKNYRRVKFWISKNKTLELLKENVVERKKLKDGLYVFGKAIKTFRRDCYK